MRGPIFGKKVFWVYRNGDRVHVPPHFSTASAARRFCEREEARDDAKYAEAMQWDEEG